ncbi:MAG: acetyl-CoA carboxylase biotin carboxyl carrier protein subunit [Gelidibacter sp.]
MNSKPLNSFYSVTMDNGQELKINQQEIYDLDAIKTSDCKFHILQNNQSFEAEILKDNFASKSYKVKVNNNTYNIQINNSLHNLIKELGFEVGANKRVNDIKAPMPGLILDINVNVGQEVNENDPLLILEAMKMENVIISPREGVIKSIAVEKGNAVDKNQLLIEFE